MTFRQRNPYRNKIFVSYSHHDEKWLARLRVHLKPLERDGKVEIWDDTMLKPGSNWRQEIKEAISSASVAVLLVSPDFLASDFISKNELPPLLEAAEKEGVIIISLIVSPCRFEETNSISKYQAVNSPKEPLIGQDKSDQESTFLSLTRTIEDAVSKMVNLSQKATSNEAQDRIVGKKNIEANFSDIGSIEAFISLLQERFSFIWEPSGFLYSNAEALIFWPVRLRKPTPIHAVQSFAAAGLQMLGAKVILFLDDLGDTEATVEEFHQALKRWFGIVSADHTQVDVRLCSEIVNASDVIWKLLQNWFSHHSTNMGEVIKVTKLLQSLDLESSSLAELARRRPRRLMTPPVVWASLIYLHNSAPDHRIITLGGQDERELWRAWRERARTSHIRLGHLYVPKLLSPSPDEDGVLHMARTPIDWDAQDDIIRAFQVGLSSSTGIAWKEPNRIIPWCLSGCLLLPSLLANDGQSVRLGRNELKSIEDLDSVDDPQELINPLAREVAKWILS